MLELNFTSQIVILIMFLLMVFILNKILYKPILSFMEKRESLLRNNEDEANRNKKAKEKYEDQAREIVLTAKKRASRLIEEEIKKAKEQAKKIIDEARENLESKREIFLDNLEEDKKQLKSSLTSQIPIFRKSIKTNLSRYKDA